MQPQFSVSGFKNNESVLSTVLALIYLGSLRVEAITGIYISRGNVHPSPPHFKKFTEDTIFISGNEVLPASIKGTLAGFPSTNVPKGLIRITRGSGRIGREALRAMHESAFEAWTTHQNARVIGDGNRPVAGATELVVMQRPTEEVSVVLAASAGNEGIFAQLTKLMIASEENRAKERAEDQIRQDNRDKMAEERREVERAAEAEVRRLDILATEERWKAQLLEQKTLHETSRKEEAAQNQAAHDKRMEERVADVEERRAEKQPVRRNGRSN